MLNPSGLSYNNNGSNPRGNTNHITDNLNIRKKLSVIQEIWLWNHYLGNPVINLLLFVCRNKYCGHPVCNLIVFGYANYCSVIYLQLWLNNRLKNHRQLTYSFLTLKCLTSYIYPRKGYDSVDLLRMFKNNT